MNALAFLDGAVPQPIPVPVIHHRPSGYSEDVARRICDEIVSGKILREICDGKDGKPAHRATVYRWLAEEPDFRVLYNWATRCRTDALAEDGLEIIDSATSETLNVALGRVDYRKWLLTKQMPRVYGVKPDDMPPPPPNGDDAKTINDPQKMLEADPLYPQVLAWEQAVEKVKP